MAQPKTFYHRPNIGDVLYALPVIRHLGGGILYLDPGPEGDYPIFGTSLSFLRRQPYIVDCRLYGGEKWDYDLDGFRSVIPKLSLIACHFRCIGLETPAEISPWLCVKPTERRYPVVIHRSSRYHGEVNYNFLHGVTKGDLFCVGFEDEVKNFREAVDAIWLPTPTLDDLATIIAASQVFIGNQSSPLAVAVGLGKNRLIEECPWCPDCTFGHANELKMGMYADANFEKLCRLGYTPQ